MTIMHSTSTINDLKIKGQPPNIRLHKLKGDRKDEWSVTIQLPWAITFKFKNGEFSEVKIKNTNPLHAGEILNEVYMKEMSLNQSQLAELCKCTPRKINEIVNGKRGIS